MANDSATIVGTSTSGADKEGDGDANEEEEGDDNDHASWFMVILSSGGGSSRSTHRADSGFHAVLWRNAPFAQETQRRGPR